MIIVIFIFIASAISGAAWGLHEKTAHHWPQFTARFPSAKDNFWNPDISWLNKYRGRDTKNGRNKIPIWFTDAAHLLASINQIFIFFAGCCVFMADWNTIWQYPLLIGISFAGYHIGNRITFVMLY
jgi:hypothetical protein